jgi:hypothetical protein
VETDQAFVEIFGRRPDWLSELEGRACPVQASVARPKVFKAKVESDLVLEPSDPNEPCQIWEFQFYYDRGIFVRAESARLAQWRQLNPATRLRRRDFVPRSVEGIVVFGDRSLCPPGGEEFPHIKILHLDERLAELEREDPNAPLLLLLRPLVVDADSIVEENAADDYHHLQDHARLDEDDRRCFSVMFMQFLMQRFRNRSPEQIRAMIKELVPVEETRAGRELIEKGRQDGIDKGIEKGKAQATLEFVCRLRDQGLAPEEIARLTGLSLEQVDVILVSR